MAIAGVSFVVFVATGLVSGVSFMGDAGATEGATRATAARRGAK